MSVLADRITTLEDAAEAYKRDGFLVTGPVLSAEAVDAARAGIDRVVAGEYETGREPRLRQWSPGDGDQRLVKISEPHRSDRRLRRLIADPALKRWAAAVSGARMVQVWAVDLFVKPRTRQPTANIGWHQDGTYGRYWRGDPFTLWIALSEVRPDSSPLLYVRGSHQLGLLQGGDLHATDLDQVRRDLNLPPDYRWDEVTAAVPRGGLAFHHHLTLHASGPNLSAEPRVAIALRLRTERCRLVTPDTPPPPVRHLADEVDAPVIHDARGGW